MNTDIPSQAHVDITLRNLLADALSAGIEPVDLELFIRERRAQVPGSACPECNSSFLPPAGASIRCSSCGLTMAANS